MTFSTELIDAGKPILNAIMDHPFIKGLASGNISKKALMFYVTQDWNYLNAYLKVDAAGIAKAENREDAQIFINSIDFLLSNESEAHKNFCAVAGVSYESLQHKHVAPLTELYTDHMLVQGNKDLIDVAAGILPCPWTYEEIADSLVKNGKNTKTNPFTPWINFYSGLTLPNDIGERDQDNADTDATQGLMNLIDRLAPKYDQQRLNEVKDTFLRSCEMEWNFWDQAYYQKDWQFVSGVKLPELTVKH